MSAHPPDDVYDRLIPIDVDCEPAQRRWWLLLRAIQILPLDAAVDLAMRAESFLVGNAAKPEAENGAGSHSVRSKLLAFEDGVQKAAVPISTRRVEKNGLTLRPATETHSECAQHSKCGKLEVAPAEIVRYLRQQGDVVVGAGEEGQYLVNGRFRLTLEELWDRAERMRSRQNKLNLTKVAFVLCVWVASCLQVAEAHVR